MQKSLSQRGFSLIEILVVIGLSSFVMTGAGFLIIDAKKSEKKAQNTYWLQEQRLQIQRSVQSDGKWAGIKAANTDMGCFDAGTSCSAFTTPQRLRLPVNNLIIDGTSPALGLTPEATFCYAFDPTNGNDACPYGLNMTWKAVCDNADCKNAQPRIDIKFKSKTQNSPTAVGNLNAFNITAFKDTKTQNLNDVCAGMGGTYSGSTCNIPSVNVLCNPSAGAAATFPIGFDDQGEVRCGNPILNQCPTDEVVVGFNNLGNVICAPKCAAGPAVVNCQGSWGTCSQPCGPTGIQTYTINTPATGGGSACESTNGGTRACNTQTCGTSTDCQGSWSTCSQCPGQQTFSILNQAQNGGAPCGAAHNDTRACSNGACSTSPVNCQGAWSTCDQNTGLETYIITTPAQNSGAACSAAAGQTRSCAVNCIGYWDDICQGTPPNAYVSYIETVSRQGQGLPCPHRQGGRDYSGDESGVFCNNPSGPPPAPTNSCIALQCLVAGTKVKLASGKYIDIENIKAGDQVLSYDEHSKKQRIDTVDRPTSHDASWQTLHHFELVNGVRFSSNDVHPFYVVEKDQYFEAQEILKMLENKEKISFLSDQNTPLKVQRITVERKFVPVYNLEVKGIAKTDSRYGKYGRGHNYFVHGILTHNKYPRNADGSCPGASYPTSPSGGACANCPGTRPNYDGIGMRCCW